jgi:hypothetical protein
METQSGILGGLLGGNRLLLIFLLILFLFDFK